MTSKRVSPKDHEILGVLGILSTILIFIVDRIPNEFNYIISLCYIFIGIVFLLGSLWSIYQILYSDSPLMTRFKWFTVIFLFISPLILSILIVYNIISIYSNYKNIFLFIICIYAIAMTCIFIIDYLYKRIIFPRIQGL